VAGSSRRTRSAGIVFGWSVLVGVCSILAYVAVGRGELLDARAETPRAEQAEPKRATQARARSARFNVTLSARSATFTRGRDGVTRLVLGGVSPLVEMADVSPGHERQAIATWIWASEWKRLYRGFEPNTTVVWREKGKRRAITVSLASGVRRGTTLSFAVRRLALGSRLPLPITTRVFPERQRRLGPVDVFVDPVADPGAAQGIVQTALQTLAGLSVSDQSWTVTSGSSTPTPLADGGVYKSIVNASGGSSFTLNLNRATGFDSGALGLAEVRIAPTPPAGGGGGYFRNIDLSGGTLTLGSLNGGPATGLVFDAVNLTGGDLVIPSYTPDSPVSNVFADLDLTRAEVTVTSMPGAIFVTPTIDGTTFTGNGPGQVAEGATFLGVDFTKGFSVSGGFTFEGATLAPWPQETPTGATQNVVTRFDGLTLGSAYSFGNSIATGALLSEVSMRGTMLSGTPFVGAALIFLSITIPLTRFTDYLLTRERDRTGGSRVR